MEAPGTAPGSATSIPNNVYHHSLLQGNQIITQKFSNCKDKWNACGQGHCNSKIASTSTAAPSGKDDTPTAALECLLLSPNTPTIKSEAPFIILARNMVSYDDGIFIDTAKMMTGLNKYLKSKKINFVQKKVKSFDELDGKFIFNCSGLGSAELNNDKEMVSIQGHLIMLKDQNPKDLQYMILVYFNEAKTKYGQKVKRSFYIFPKHLANIGANDVGVIGGTFIEGATPKTPNEEDFDIMMQGAKKFYGIE